MLKKLKTLLLFLVLILNCKAVEFSLNIKDSKIIENKKMTGLFVTKSKDIIKMPFGKRFIGYDKLNFPGDVFYISNYINGEKCGSEICMNRYQVFYIAEYLNNKFHGQIQLYPNGFYSVNFMVKNNQLDGPFSFKFKPYKYAASAIGKETQSNDADYKGKVNYNKNYEIIGKGYFKNNKIYQGTFLNIKFDGLYRIVSVWVYKAGKLVDKKKAEIFKIPSRIIEE